MKSALTSLNISASDREAILGGNAAKLFGIKANGAT